MRAMFGRVMAMSDLVAAFLEGHFADDQGIKLRIEQLNQLRSRGHELVRQQSTSGERSIGANQARAIDRRRLSKGLLQFIVRVMERAGEAVPEVRGIRVPRATSHPKFVTAAGEVLDLAAAHLEKLVPLGLTKELLDQAKSIYGAYVENSSYSNEQLLDRVGATRALRSVESEIRRAVRELNGLMEHRFVGDPESLAKWNRARNVVNPGVRSSRGEEPPSGTGGDVPAAA